MNFRSRLGVQVAALLGLFLMALGGCTQHSDPLKNWQDLGWLSQAEVPEMIRQDARAYFRTLPDRLRTKAEKSDWAVSYLEDGTSQHAVVLEDGHNGEYWRYALIYDRDNRRIKVLKYSTGSYMS